MPSKIRIPEVNGGGKEDFVKKGTVAWPWQNGGLESRQEKGRSIGNCRNMNEGRKEVGSE